MRIPRFTRLAVGVSIIGIVLTCGACAAASIDRAGGDAARPERVLAVAQPAVSPAPALQAWADQVHALSGGSLRVEFKNEWQAHRADAEAATVEDVRRGRVDGAVVGARIFDRFGVTAFHALLAPLLVDSQALQSTVFEAGIPDQMADQLQQAGVVGLGALPGPIRKVIGVAKPLVRLSDFHGATVGMQDSALTARTLTALGAVPKAVPASTCLTGLDAYEQQLASIVGNHYVDQAKFVTVNLDLWPRPLVVFTSTAALSSLTSQERAALRDAMAAARPIAEETAQKEDATSAPTLCRDGMTLSTASAENLHELVTALAPLMHELAAEPGTGTWLDQIRALKAKLAAGPDSQTCGGSTAAPVTSPIPDGTYERLSRSGEAVLGCPPDGDPPGLTRTRWTLRLVLHQGTVEEYSLTGGPSGVSPELGWLGTYRVFKDRVDFLDNAGAVTSFSTAWKVEGKDLTLADMTPFVCGDANVWLHTWTRVS
jgi:TRAP-type C4-dicarboxylate transport system substrate-binding protein